LLGLGQSCDVILMVLHPVAVWFPDHSRGLKMDPYPHHHWLADSTRMKRTQIVIENHPNQIKFNMLKNVEEC
jgi:hypothetical protein